MAVTSSSTIRHFSIMLVHVLAKDEVRVQFSQVALNTLRVGALVVAHESHKLDVRSGSIPSPAIKYLEVNT